MVMMASRIGARVADRASWGSWCLKHDKALRHSHVQDAGINSALASGGGEAAATTGEAQPRHLDYHAPDRHHPSTPHPTLFACTASQQSFISSPVRSLHSTINLEPSPVLLILSPPCLFSEAPSAQPPATRSASSQSMYKMTSLSSETAWSAGGLACKRVCAARLWEVVKST